MKHLRLLIMFLLIIFGLHSPLCAAQKIAVFLSDNFPSVDAAPVDSLLFVKDTHAYQIFRTPLDVQSFLSTQNISLLILPYGSAFPADAWQSIRKYLDAGGNLLVIGGAPFAQPVWRDSKSGRWISGNRQPSYAHELLIGPAEEIETRNSWTIQTAQHWHPSPGFQLPRHTFALTMRFTTERDFPDEDGTSGPIDGECIPLVHAVDRNDIPRAALCVEINWLRGPKAGGRWIFATTDGVIESQEIRYLVRRAERGASQLNAVPYPACVRPGEQVTLRVAFRKYQDTSTTAAATVNVYSSDGTLLRSQSSLLRGPARLLSADVELPPVSTPGLYTIVVKKSDADSSKVQTGFWVRDDSLLQNGDALTASKDWLRVKGDVVPIVGTTFMAPDVQRKFLFEPNPFLWDFEFGRMEKSGINFVRTGLWNSWSRVQIDPGAYDENVLKAFDAYVLSAAKHHIYVCFTFFAFTPPLYGGSNPYLDPRALEGQTALVTAVARRFHGSPWVHFDLINEPSYSPPDKLWQNRPIGDPYELSAWKQWLIDRFGTNDAALRERWRDPSPDLRSLPSYEELIQTMVRNGKNPRKALDFSMFSQEMVRRWAFLLRDAIRNSGNNSLVTIGQDEGGTSTRPAQPFHADALDYTAIHTWWNSDDLLWDAAVTKTETKPSLVQETGLMRLEDIDGNPWRSPDEAAQLLNRKVVLGFAARSAGIVQWAWNINPDMPIDNEAVIGIFRPDGTAKPEYDRLVSAAKFMRDCASGLDDYDPSEILLVLPHSRMFMGQPDGINGTQKIIRILADRFGVVPATIPDVLLTDAAAATARLIILPSTEYFPDSSAKVLLRASRRGARVIVLGNVTGEDAGAGQSLLGLGVGDSSRPLYFHEHISGIAGDRWISFFGKKDERLRCSVAAATRDTADHVWIIPQPIEFANEDEPLITIFSAALKSVSISSDPSSVPCTAAVLPMKRSVLVCATNESPRSVERIIEWNGKRKALQLLPGESTMLLLDKATFDVLHELKNQTEN